MGVQKQEAKSDSADLDLFAVAEEKEYRSNDKLIVRVDPRMMQFIDFTCKHLGMNRSDLIRFMINRLKYDYSINRYVLDKERVNLDLFEWMTRSSQKRGMSAMQFITDNMTIIKFLDDSGDYMDIIQAIHDLKHELYGDSVKDKLVEKAKGRQIA